MNATFLISTLLCFLPTTISAVAAGSIDGSAAALDQWISENVVDFHLLTQEIGAGAGLDLPLVQAEIHRRFLTVRQDGKGDFTTISGAVDSIPENNVERVVIRIGSGVYKEKVKVVMNKPFVTFSGDRYTMPKITFNGTAAEFGTLDSATVIIESSYFVANNIIFENSAPRPVVGVEGAQAVAMRISGDMAAFYNCKFLGYQDTLCDDRGKHFFKNCFIQGTVDFIFGDGRSIYQNCKINSVADGITYITAQAKSTAVDNSGFSFVNCIVTGTGNVYLSRAWRKYSRVIFSYTYMDSVVNPKGWDDEGFMDRDQTVFYGEYKCRGPGSATGKRVSYVKLLTDEQVQPFLNFSFIRGNKWILPQPQL